MVNAGKGQKMNLSIRNFAKIGSADIIVDGITVIAGENNTGKSTVGKILFSLFNAASGIEEKIVRQRLKEVEEGSWVLLRNYAMHMSTGGRLLPSVARTIATRISKSLAGLDNPGYRRIYRIVEKSLSREFARADEEELEEMTERIARQISEIFALPEEQIVLEILSRYFCDVFHEQINSLAEPDSPANLELNIKNRRVGLTFQNNRCTKFESELSLVHKAVYIDNPFIIDRLNQYNEGPTDLFLESLLTRTSDDDIMDGIIGTVLAREKMAEIYQALESVVNGRIVIKNEEDYYLEKDGWSQPISFANLSVGLKSFVILKMLIERGALEEKDVIVLDEPEVHLHPQWQVAYAELIVLMQKYFDLSVVVTTHSPYFLDAIELFSGKHGIGGRVNYYLSSIENDRVKMDCVTGDIERIYQKMASPIQVLDTLRYELNNK